MARRSLEDLAPKAMDTYDVAGRGVPSDVLPTGHRHLDDVLAGGFRPGQVCLITGAPGVGTSTFALGVIRAAALKHQRPAVVLSLQSRAQDIFDRIVCAEGRVPIQHLRAGTMSDDDWKRLAPSMAAVVEAPLYVDDAFYRDLIEFDDSLSGDDRTYDVVMLDGAQLLARRTAPEHLWAAHTSLSAGIKRLARERRTVVLVTAPLTRSATRQPYPVPQPGGNVATSAAYESDADIVITLHREDMYDRETPRAGEADIIVQKSRYGPTRTVTVAFQGHYARFVDMVQA